MLDLGFLPILRYKKIFFFFFMKSSTLFRSSFYSEMYFILNTQFEYD